MIHSLSTNMRILLVTSFALCLSACALLPRDSLPEQPIKSLEQIEPTLDVKTSQIGDAWWKEFGDPQLNQLIALGLKNSPSLETSGARIVAAQAMLDAERAAFLPQIGVNGQLAREQLSQNYIFVPGMPIYTGYGLANASLNWSLDIWGKQKKYFDAAKNQVIAAQASHQASQLLLSTSIARIYLDYDRMTAAQALFARDADLKRSLYQIAQDKKRAGLIDAMQVNQRQVEFETAQANLSQASFTVKMLQHQLAALVQEGPSWGESLKAPMVKVVGLGLPDVIPSNLLERRPDLQALLSQIDVARLQLDGAKLEYLPDVNLAGFVGVQSFGISQLLSSRSQQFSIGPAISLPIFDGGAIAANITGKESVRNQAIANYQEQLVQALRDVADGIGSMKSSQANFESYNITYQSAKLNYDISRQRAKAGISSQEVVLTNEESYLAQGQNFADAKAKMLTANVVLVQALGGSYMQHSKKLD
jgi:NodT family efflux transporter outer membrane factor (OMF) lipoprotein